MNLQLLRAYLAYRLKAKHRHGHGIHSPFMYELVRSVLFAKKEKHEASSRQGRTAARLSAFCAKHRLTPMEVRETNDLHTYAKGCIALLEYPHKNAELWQRLAEHTHTTVTANCRAFGMALAVPHLHKQQYTIAL